VSLGDESGVHLASMLHDGLVHALRHGQRRPIKARGARRTVDHIVYATAEWVDWFGYRRSLRGCARAGLAWTLEPEVHPEPHQAHGLLAALVPFGVLVQPEVALTRSIWWLLGLWRVPPARWTDSYDATGSSPTTTATG
jgi:hypothetical protein